LRLLNVRKEEIYNREYARDFNSVSPLTSRLQKGGNLNESIIKTESALRHHEDKDREAGAAGM
jgi:hypothetical protein